MSSLFVSSRFCLSSSRFFISSMSACTSGEVDEPWPAQQSESDNLSVVGLVTILMKNLGLRKLVLDVCEARVQVIVYRFRFGDRHGDFHEMLLDV